MEFAAQGVGFEDLIVPCLRKATAIARALSSERLVIQGTCAGQWAWSCGFQNGIGDVGANEP